MKLIKKVKSIEPKRCFVFSQRFTSKNMRVKSVKDSKIKVDKKAFEKDLGKAKKEMLKIGEKKLDRIIADEYKPRLNAYNKMDWYMGYVDVDEIGAWRGAGGVPKTWTKRSLKSTADIISKQIADKNTRYKRVRAVKVVPEIMAIKNILKKEEYLLPIILPAGTSRSSRKGMNKLNGYIDDGNMRSFAFVISGDKKIKAYIGVKKQKAEKKS